MSADRASSSSPGYNGRGRAQKKKTVGVVIVFFFVPTRDRNKNSQKVNMEERIQNTVTLIVWYLREIYAMGGGAPYVFYTIPSVNKTFKYNFRQAYTTSSTRVTR